ncbi:MAG: tRNA 2-selenouridine(34) synthase MnmH [Betaproteobacteria bacterium]
MMGIDTGDFSGTTRFPPKPGTIRLPLALDALRTYDTIIDARSHAEWAQDHLPGAESFPVLTNEERVIVGTLYKQTSGFAAKKVGAAMVARNIARHLEEAFHDKPKSWRPLIYCWRGGSRSGAFTHVLRQIGWDAAQLEGGYKRWRTQVVGDLGRMPAAFTFVAVCGRTGSGKSRLLEALTHLGAQVLDLEGLAEHKGSVLGDLPNQPQPTQKQFETRLWQTLSTFDPTQAVFVEAESKKIGLLRIPDAIIKGMWEGQCVELMTSKPLRVELLCDDYVHLIGDPELLCFKIDCLRALHSNERIATWHSLVDTGDWKTLVAALLESHYDPAYDRSMFRNYRHIGQSSQIELAAVSDDGFRAAANRILSLSLHPPG